MDHELNRKGVCVLCLKKASKDLTEKDKQRLKDVDFIDYDKNDSSFPSGICPSCQIKLRLSPEKLPKIEFYDLKRKQGNHGKEKNVHITKIVSLDFGASLSQPNVKKLVKSGKKLRKTLNFFRNGSQLISGHCFSFVHTFFLPWLRKK
jgi:hypothetical protein